MYSSHILARIHMKLGTHIDLIEPNKFHTACHWLCPTGSRLFRAVYKTHALEFDILLWGLPPVCHQTRRTWSQDIGDAKLPGYFWYLERFARGEAMNLWRKMRDRKRLITSTYIVWFWSNFRFCSLYDAERIDVTIRSQSYSATNWQQEVCHFQNALNSASYF